MAASESVNRLSIGAFSRRCRLPISTLRYYHETSVLVPVEVDPESGYRYYSITQLPVANLITELRAVGLTPDQIRGVLDASDPVSTLATARDGLIADLAEREQQLRRLDQLIEDYDNASQLGVPVATYEAFVWAISRTVTASADRLVRTVRRGFAQLRRDSGLDGRFAATFPLELDGDEFDVELHIEASEPAAPTITVPVLAVSHTGPHRHLWRAYDRLLEHAEQNGLEPGGRITERYLPLQRGQFRADVLLHLTESEPNHDRC